MFGVSAANLPGSALLSRYESHDNYTDCFSTTVTGDVSIADYVDSFYTTWLFKCERFILKWLVKRPSTDADAKAVADGKAQSFAAWTVEDRTETQLLMCDFQGRTRSWMMVDSTADAMTHLYFGSAVLPKVDSSTGQKNMGFIFRVLLGFHRAYSVALLSLATRRLNRRR